MTVVVPPTAAEALPLAKLSAFTVGPPRGSSIWVWLSMPPGSTSLPVASISFAPAPRPPAQRHDLPADDADIAGEDVAGGGDGPVADDQVEFRAWAGLHGGRLGAS